MLGVRLCNRTTRDVALTSLGDLECAMLALSAFTPAFLTACYIKKGRGVRI